MEQDGPRFIERTIEIAQTTHKIVSALGFMFWASGSVDASNVIFYCLSITAARNRHVKVLPYTQRSDPFMFAKPDESQQGVTVIIPITGPVPLVTHQGSQQVVILLFTLMYTLMFINVNVYVNVYIYVYFGSMK